ncbi:hypothetical protein BGZ50_005528, partial [Haplosporangium sp. Z 11]
MIGVHLPRATFDRMLKQENELRAAAKASPAGTHYIVRRKNVLIEEVLNHWLQIQRKQNVPVNSKMIKNVCTVLVELQDDSDETVPEKRYQITDCQLHGEAGSVNLGAIEPELANVRQLCAQYTPDNIFNCDETDFYLSELDNKPYTTPGSKSGAKASRSYK